jgi:acetolactate synthase I/III small subunit
MTPPDQPASAYFIDDAPETIVRATLAVIVDNEPGVLARVVGLFSARGYNIESLTVAETDHSKHMSRVTVVTSGTAETLAQIKAQLDRLVPVHRVIDLEGDADALRRELALIKVVGEGDQRVEALRLADAFKARVLDATLNSFVFELTGSPKKIDDFVNLMRPIGLVELSRTGIAGIRRGATPL